MTDKVGSYKGAEIKPSEADVKFKRYDILANKHQRSTVLLSYGGRRGYDEKIHVSSRKTFT